MIHLDLYNYYLYIGVANVAAGGGGCRLNKSADCRHTVMP